MNGRRIDFVTWQRIGGLHLDRLEYSRINGELADDGRADVHPAEKRNAQDWYHGQVDQKVSEHDLAASNRLREQQFHGAAIDFAGNRSGRSADSPDAQDSLHKRMHGADGEGLLRIEE